MAKKSSSRSGDDVPGIFKKRKPVLFKAHGRSLTADEQTRADAAFDELWNRPSWRERFDTLGPQLKQTAQATDANVRMAADRAIHIWQCIVADLAKPKSKRRSAEWYVEWSMQLRWQLDKAIFWPFDDVVRSRNKSDRAIKQQNAKRQRDKTSRQAKLRRDAEQAIEDVKSEYPNMADRVDTIKTKAATRLGIGKRQLNERLKY